MNILLIVLLIGSLIALAGLIYGIYRAAVAVEAFMNWIVGN